MSPSNKLFVFKRDGRKEEVHFDKITSRIQKLCYGLNMDFVDPASITLKVVSGLYPGVHTTELDDLAAETAATKMIDHPDYGTLAARIEISNLHKETKKQFSDVIQSMYDFKSTSDLKQPMVSEEVYRIVMKYAERLNSCIIYDRDFTFNYFGFKLLEQSYLRRIDKKIVERPQHMFMRVAVEIHRDDIDSVIETYNLLSEKYYIHSSNTLRNSAYPINQLSSAFVSMMPSDSIEGIFACIANCGFISKNSGGVGVAMQNIRAKGSYIAGTNGTSNGLVPMLRVFDALVDVPEQVNTKKKAELTIYIEPWHADVFEFLNLKRPTGKDELRARNLNYALWVPDIFMKRVEDDGIWSLMCPNNCPGLVDTWGEEFEKLYEDYERKGNFIKQVQAQELWKAIVLSQLECEMPFIMYKDSSNRKSNQKHMGTLKSGDNTSSNLGLGTPEEISVCTQASIPVDMYVNPERKRFDFQKLKEVVKVVTKNLDRSIDVNFYTLPQQKRSSLKYRPMSIGVQGLADAFILLRLPFDSEEAALLNKQIFETIYYAALESSCELAEKLGPYPAYEGSPISQGTLQYDMWQVQPTPLWNWDELKQKISKHGVRNSLLTAVMPTTNLSEILGDNESIEPFKSNIVFQRVNSCDVQVVNHLLLRDLTERNLWTDELKSEIISKGGSIQTVESIPDELKQIYKTIWEIKQKVILNMAKDRGAFLDQSQAIDVYMERPTYSSLCSMHFYGWRSGLKTGTCRLKAKSKNVQMASRSEAVQKVAATNGESMEVEKKQQAEEEMIMAAMVCSLSNPEACEMCGA